MATRGFVALVLALGAARSASADPRPQIELAPPDQVAPDPAAPVSKIIFLERCVGGCVYHESPDNDSLMNKTWLGGGAPNTVYALSEFPYGDATWDAIVACMRETYAPYDVEITEVDPGSTVPHHEAVIAGTADQLDLDPTVYGGVGPLYPDCHAQDNSLSFTFAEAFNDDPIFLCSVAAQESGHAFGLDHSYNCADPMTYLDACGLQFFRNELAQCGEHAPRGCQCALAGQNTHGKLKSVLGANPVPLPAPTMALQMPAMNATVGAEFPIAASAIDRRGLSKMELWFNGHRWLEQAVDLRATTVTATAPPDLPDGVIDVEVRVYNDLHSSYGSATATVTKGAACTTADTCLPGQRCDAGRCLWDAPTGELGAACEYPQFCVSELCEQGACTQVCDVPNPCPFGYECAATGFCQSTEPADAGGCCSTSASPPTGMLLGQLGLAGLVLGGVLRRRRRR